MTKLAPSVLRSSLFITEIHRKTLSSHYQPSLPYFFFKIKGKTSSEEKENNQMNKNQNKETHPCAMVPCSALKTSQIRHQLHTWRLGHRTSQPWVGSAVVCGAVHGRCVLSLWAPSHPGVKYFYQKRTPAAKIPLSALRPSSYGILFSPPF